MIDRFLIFTAIIFTCLITVSCGSKAKQESQAQENKGPRGPMKVDGYIVQTKPVSEQLQVPGTLVAEDETQIHPEVPGRITGLYIKEGAYVPKGALIAKLYDADLQAQKRKLQVQLQIQQQTANRHKQLLDIGGISKEDYETTVLNASSTRADLAVIETSIQKTEIRAPFSGKLGLKMVSPGAYVTTQSVITSIQKTNSLRIDFDVPEKYAVQMKKGDIINFQTDATGKRIFSAVVFATESGITEATRTLTIRARVNANQTGLIPGGFVKVNLVFNSNPNALMVPTQAIIPQARTKQIIIYKGGTAEFTNVTTGVRDSANVEILSGVEKGDTIITTGLMSLKPNMKVSIRKVSNH
jgi:membrane fusion protein (multidrug efflux system)